mgnify:CR=1 FL=1
MITNVDLEQQEANSLDECIDQAMGYCNEANTLRTTVRNQNSPNKKQKVEDLRPMVFLRMNSRSTGKPKPITIKALLDSGASGTIMDPKIATKLKKQPSTVPTVWTTPSGAMSTNEESRVQFTIPELHEDRMIQWTSHIASQSIANYDMIIGRDLLRSLAIDIKFSNETVEWDGAYIPMKGMNASIETDYHIEDSFVIDSAASRIKTILDAKYVKANLEEIVNGYTHLTKDERKLLLILLKKYEPLFDGTLGQWTGSPYEIELKEGAQPYHVNPYPIPHAYRDTLRMEVERLCKIGVLKKVNHSEWGAPTFIIPKKDKTVRFISDFRELNKRIKRKPYPIPKIQDLLSNLEGFQYATSLDLNMGYYHIELSPASKKLCTIVLPFGKYEYQKLPMGLCNSPDIFQEKMSELFQGMDQVRTYLDDLLCTTSGTFEEHLELVDKVLQRLQNAGLKVNAKKSFFAKGELEYLGYWITRESIQPVDKKVKAIQNLEAPKTKKELRRFIGLVNYYRDMWIKRSHTLAPLTKLTSKEAKWQWTEIEQAAFDTMKKIIGKQTMLAYPDYSKPFDIHTDASHLQLGAVISQDGQPIAFYSRKLQPAQTRYTTTERELLSIVETLKEFRNILLGQKIHVYTDHKNLTCKNFNTERVMRWRLILEEYGPELHYVKGEHNIVADALSRLDLHPTNSTEATAPDETYLSELYAADDEELPQDAFPLTYRNIALEQNKDKQLMKTIQSHTKGYELKVFHGGGKKCPLICFNGKIVMPTTLQRRCVEWYHNILLHPGTNRTEETIRQHFYWKDLRDHVKKTCARCQTCQLTKKQHIKYGLLPPKEAEADPWETLCVDLIGPYKITRPHMSKKHQDITLHCLTMIDPATGWFEIVPIRNKTAIEVANQAELTWFTRYPWPTKIIFDRGTEFMGEFAKMCKEDYGIKKKPITTRNPQANAVLERIHQTIGNMIRSTQVQNSTEEEPWAGILAAVAFATRATYHTTLQATPAQLVFGRDAILNVKFEANWQYIKQRKQQLINKNNALENAKRKAHEYRVNDQVMVKNPNHRKFGSNPYIGPFTVVAVNDNGTVELQQALTRGTVTKPWNIRQLKPYKA